MKGKKKCPKCGKEPCMCKGKPKMYDEGGAAGMLKRGMASNMASQIPAPMGKAAPPMSGPSKPVVVAAKRTTVRTPPRGRRP